MQTSSWLGVAVVIPGLLAGVGISWFISRRGNPAAPVMTFRDLCGHEEACWAVRSSRSSLRSLSRASDGRYWIFNNESPPRGAYADGVDMEMVRAPSLGVVQNHTMGEAHDCMVDRCDEPLRNCGRSFACRGAWTKLLGELGSVVEVALLRPEHIAHEDSRELASCFFSQCLCVADLAIGDRTGGGTLTDASPNHVMRFPDAIDDDDVHAILSLAASIGENASFVEERNFGALPRGESSPLGGQMVTYLQSRFTTDPLTARLYARLRKLAIRADVESGWRRAHAPTLVPRTIELLNYTSSAQHADASFSLGWHIDEESALTALLLLSDPANFSGGELFHLAQGQKHAARPRQHELLIYRSHTPHAVGALSVGTRLVVALEFWHVQAPGQGVEHPAYPYRRIGYLPRPGVSAPMMTTLGRCPK
jgi:hypothetical protein